MIQYVYSVKDIRTNTFNNPSYSPLGKFDFAESIKRGVMTEAIKPEAARHSQLYYLGTYEDEKATFNLEKQPELICELYKYVEEPSKPAGRDA